MADEAGTITVPTSETPAPELTLEQQLEALKPTGNESPLTEKKVGDEGTPAPVASPESEVPDPVLAKLDEIIPDSEEKPGEPAKLSPVQQQILDAIPDVETAQQLQAVAEGYQNFAGAFALGKFDDVSKMLDTWNPAAYDAFLNHIYEQKVASGEWVDRYIAEKDPKADKHTNKAIQNLNQTVKQLQAKLDQRATEETSQNTSAQQDRIVRAYVDHIDGLFDQLDFSPNDRRWVAADIHNRVSEDPRVKAAINSGDVAAVNKIFRSALTDYVNRDKVTSTKTSDKLAAQARKKAPLQSVGITQEGALPESIREVPKGKEDSWMDQQLNALKAKVLGKKK